VSVPIIGFGGLHEAIGGSSRSVAVGCVGESRRRGDEPFGVRRAEPDGDASIVFFARLRGEVVFVDQAAEPVVAAEPIERDRLRRAFVVGLWWALLGRRSLAKCPVGSVLVVGA
jgi:hypothetical protein